MAVDPTASMDNDCPAGFVESEHSRFNPVSVTVTPTEGGTERDAVFQPWTCGTGATYVAWRIGFERGRLGVYDSDRKRIWLGPVGYPEGRGRYRYFVDLNDATETLKNQVQCGHSSNQSPNATAHPGSLDEWRGNSSYISPRHPAPSDAAVIGDLHAFELSWWQATSKGLFQPWRPVSGGAVYIAFFIDDYFGEFGVYDDHSVWFGRTGPISGCYFAHPEDNNTFRTLEKNVNSIYKSVPNSGFEVK